MTFHQARPVRKALSLAILTGMGLAGAGAADAANLPVAPVVTTSGGTAAFIENSGAATVDPGLVVRDLDNATLSSAAVAITGNFASAEDMLVFANDGSTMGNISASYNAATGVLMLTSAGATAMLVQWQAALRSVAYANSSDTPNTASRTVSFTVNDGAADSVAASRVVSVAAANDAPVVTTSGGTAALIENSGAVTVDPGLVIGDLDNATLSSAAVAITGNFASAEDMLVFANDGSTMGNISASYNAATGVLMLTSAGATATLVQWQAALRSVAYANSSDTPNTANRTVSFTVNDGADDSVAASRVVSVASVNNAPVATAPAGISVIEDVATPLTGISFSDADAGGGSVTATLSLPSGSLAASSGSGATVGGTGSALTLTGSIADINAFIAASSVTFQTAANATGSVVLAIAINDGGNTGSGGAQTDSTTVALAVTAVNDPPVNSVPAAQSVDQDGTLVFSSGNGNLVATSDVDAGGNSVRATLAASNGLVSLGGTTGLVFIVGDGSADATLSFEGTLGDINLALNGMVFTPNAGYAGPASLQVTTEDLGSSGSGGAQADTDTVAITVSAVQPVVASVGATNADGGYKVGDAITATVSFDQPVIVDTSGGAPMLLLETGAIDRQAGYVSGSGSSTLLFAYTVQAGDLSADLDHASTAALALNGASIRGGNGTDAVLTLPAPGGPASIAGQHDLVVDGVAPAVASVAVPPNGTYVAGQSLDFTVSFDEAVVVETSGGTPGLPLDIGGAIVAASYVSGSGTDVLQFAWTVQAGQDDADGIGLGAALAPNGGALTDAAGNALALALNGVAPTAAVLVDTTAPNPVQLVRNDADPTTAASVTFGLGFDEPVEGVDAADFTLATTGTATGAIASVTATDAQTYSITVGSLSGSGTLGLVLADSGTAIADRAGNPLATGMTGETYAVDRDAPTLTALTLPMDGRYLPGDVLEFALVFSEPVELPGTPAPALLLTIGMASVQADYVSGAGTDTLLLRYVVAEGDVDSDGIAITGFVPGTLADAQGNPVAEALPAIPPSNGILVGPGAPPPVPHPLTIPAGGPVGWLLALLGMGWLAGRQLRTAPAGRRAVS